VCQGFDIATFSHRGETEKTRHITIQYQRIFRSVWSSRLQNTIQIETNARYAERYLDTQKSKQPNTFLKRSVITSSIECFNYPFDSSIIGGYSGFICRFKGIEPSIEVQGINYQN